MKLSGYYYFVEKYPKIKYAISDMPSFGNGPL
jgi:hypothetical protein